LPNQLATFIPSAAGLSDALRVIESSGQSGGNALFLNVDSMGQRGVCYWAPKA